MCCPGIHCCRPAAGTNAVITMPAPQPASLHSPHPPNRLPCGYVWDRFHHLHTSPTAALCLSTLPSNFLLSPCSYVRDRFHHAEAIALRQLKSWLDGATSGAARTAAGSLPGLLRGHNRSCFATRPPTTQTCRQLALPRLHRRRYRTPAASHAAALLCSSHRALAAADRRASQCQIRVGGSWARQRRPERELRWKKRGVLNV